MRRLPAGLLILAPLLLGLLYAAGHAVFAPRPTLATLVPEDAVFVQRFRNLAAFDRYGFGSKDEDGPAPRDLLAASRNVPGLPGVDPDGPLHLIQMPRTLRRDSTLAVFALEDADAFERAFKVPDLIEQGATRHAQHLVIRGPWAAVAPDRDAARRIGTGGVTAEDLGEDHALAADVPRLVDHALSLAGSPPWRSILTALGVDVDAATSRQDTETGALVLHLPHLERVKRVREAWKTARMWVWRGEGRVRVDLEPRAGPLVDALAAWVRQPTESGPSPAPPSDGAFWLRTPSAGGPTLLAWILEQCGVDVPAGFPFRLWRSIFTRGGEDPWEAAWAEPGGHTLAWGVSSPDAPEAFALGIAAPTGHLPDAAALLGEEADVEIERGGAGGDLAVVTFLPGARRALARMTTHLARGETWVEPEPPEDGLRALAHFGVKADAAQGLLGPAVGPGGFLAALAGADIAGSLWTDGQVLRLEARVVR